MPNISIFLLRSNQESCILYQDKTNIWKNTPWYQDYLGTMFKSWYQINIGLYCTKLVEIHIPKTSTSIHKPNSNAWVKLGLFPTIPSCPLPIQHLGNFKCSKPVIITRHKLLQIMVYICIYKVMYIFCIFCKIKNP